MSSAHTNNAEQGGTGNVMHLAKEEDDSLTFIRPVSVSPLEVVNHFYLVQNKVISASDADQVISASDRIFFWSQKHAVSTIFCTGPYVYL